VVNSELDAVFAALADPTRRAMVAALAEQGQQTAGELAAPHRISVPAISKHLTVLEKAGLLARHRQGRHQVCTLKPAQLRAARDWIDRYQQFWTERIDSLDAYLKRETQ
jgi:DNA-binding transcriptional ArsR family regulator